MHHNNAYVDNAHCISRAQATATPELGLPPYFYFLTLLAMRIFHAEAVDVAVIEVGLGGRWDATNLVPSPVVCGITSLGYDHMEVLGHTLTLIAGEKAGIMKRGVPCVTTTQPDEAAAVLEATAQQLQVRCAEILNPRVCCNAKLTLISLPGPSAGGPLP
jgi:folylpolyglutamate synthase